MKALSIGLLGGGMMGSLLCPINEDSASRLYVRTLCDLDESVLDQMHRRFGVETTTDYDELLTDPSLDIIGVYTPDHLHLSHCLKAIEAGKHVICTKPMVMSLSEAEQIIEAVDRAGVKFFVAQSMRFNLRMMTARRLFEDGELGELILAEGLYVHDYRKYLNREKTWRRNPPIDLLVGGGCHPIDLVTWFMGPVAEVHAYASNGGLTPGYELENNFLINLKFESGRIGRVMACYGVPDPPMTQLTLTLYGTKGCWSDDRYRLDKIPGKPIQRLEFPPREAGHEQEVIRYLRHFEECLLEDKPPLVGPREAAHVLAVTDAVWRSVHTGQPVSVESVRVPSSA